MFNLYYNSLSAGRATRFDGVIGEAGSVVLRVAAPAQGLLAERACALLMAAGCTRRPDPAGSAGEVRVFRLPERDIVVHANHGGLHLALCADLAVAEASIETPVVLDLGVSGHVLASFAPTGRMRTADDLAGARIATPLPNLVRRYVAAHGIPVHSVISSDPVDHVVDLDVADAVVALVDPTDLPPRLLRMRLISVLAECRIVVVEGRAPLDAATRATRTRLLARLRAARLASEVTLLHFECPGSSLADALFELASVRPPEVEQGPEAEWSAVRVLVRRDSVLDAISSLLTWGCREILTFDPTSYERGDVPGATGSGDDGDAEPLPEPRAADAPDRSGRGRRRRWLRGLRVVD